MRILFDQNTPDPLRDFLTKHQVETADRLGWARLQNGALLEAAEKAGFEVVVTCDQNLKYQQNLSKRRIALVVVGSNRWPLLENHLPEIVAAIESASPNSYSFIEIPLPPKPR